MSACVGLGACAGPAAPGDDLDVGGDLRSGQVFEFWNLRLYDLSNGDVQLYDQDEPQIPDTIIWDIDGDEDTADVYEGPIFGGALVLSTVENQIYDGAGNVQCTATVEDGLFKLRQGLDGDVIYTATPGRYVFAGDVPGGLPSPGTTQWQELLYHQLDFEFYGAQIFAGPRWQADVIAEGSVNLHKANPMRKLMIAALYGGECGSPGVAVGQNPTTGD